MDSRIPHHVAAYGLELFRDDPDHLSGVVRFDMPRLGNVEGLDVVHLQCRIVDRHGVSGPARGPLGDGTRLLGPALVAAAELAATAGVNIDFVESELYRAVEAVGPSRFDLVYTGIGALCILPDGRRRPRRPELVSMPSIRMVVPVEVAATLRDQRLVDAAGERLVFRARLGDDAVSAVLAASEDDLEELLGHVAAEANHEKDRRRDKRLDQAFEALKDVVDRP